MSAISVRIDIVSDIVCPWCWLGWRYLKNAADQTKHNVDISWRAYMLDPDVPKDGVDYKPYMKNKFGDGPSNKFKAMREHLETAGPVVGIDFKFNGIPKRANTLAAHQLMLWAQGQGKANDMAEALFKAFFTDHRDINDRSVLIDLAENAGLDTDIVSDLFEKGADKETVMTEIGGILKSGIRGVPAYIYQGKYLVQGAQDTKNHLNIIDQIATGKAA